MAAKIFEVGDVLPATTQLKVSWQVNDWDVNRSGYITTTDSYLWIYFDIEYGIFEDGWIKVDNQRVTYLDIEEPYEIIINTSSWNVARRTVTHDTTSYVMSFSWEDLNAPSGYSITFEENGGSTVTDLTEQTALPSPLPTITKTNHVFAGWYYDNLFTQKATAGDELTANVTLYAKWYTPTTWCEDIADAIRKKEGSSGNIKHVDFADRIRAEIPSTAGGSIFTGATIPLTYKNNTHDYENNYEYKSATHKITITGLEGRATITGNGTKNVLVAFDVTSSTTSLKNFTITCVNGKQELTYKGLHAHYGETVTGILTFAYNNITHDGSEGTFGTSGLTANYKFIVTSSSDLPVFSENTTLWNTIYSHQLLNVLIGNFSGTSIGDYFMRGCYSFNQPLTLPSGLSSIGDYFMRDCYSFNQPLTLPSGLSSIGDYFIYYCCSFNQPLTLPHDYYEECLSTATGALTVVEENATTNQINYNDDALIGKDGLPLFSEFEAGHYVLKSGLSSIGDYFIYYCYSFNQPLTLPSELSSIGDYFMRGCYSFNQPLTLPSELSSIGGNFMSECYSLSTIIWNASIYPTDSNSLSQTINTKTNSTNGAGIKVYGTKRAELISALPNRTSSPYRKLINGGS